MIAFNSVYFFRIIMYIIAQDLLINKTFVIFKNKILWYRTCGLKIQIFVCAYHY